MGITTDSHFITAPAGDVYRQLTSIRRKRALFRLSVEGTNSLYMTSAPDSFGIAASYEDNGYMDEPLRAKIIAMSASGTHVQVPFEGSTPEDLVEAMITADKSYSDPDNWSS